MIKKKLKEYFPATFEWYKHMQRRCIIAEIRKRKQMKAEEYPVWLSEQYRKRIGHDLNWKNLTTYTEKMQWEKLYDDNPLKASFADKYEVRPWVADTIGEEYLIPLLGVWDKFEKIDFDTLPEKFVLKTNHGSGTNIIVNDKKSFNKRVARQKFADWMQMDFGYKTLERHYSKILPKIIAEAYIETTDGELRDYKFLCFDGKPYYCWVDMGRYSEHTRNVYDLDWKLQPWNQEEYKHYKEPIQKPLNFEKMIEIAEILSQGFSHVRVDLYNVAGKIYFGELTFTNGGGFDRILPIEYDKMLGDLWKLPMDAEQKNGNYRKMK